MIHQFNHFHNNLNASTYPLLKCQTDINIIQSTHEIIHSEIELVNMFQKTLKKLDDLYTKAIEHSKKPGIINYLNDNRHLNPLLQKTCFNTTHYTRKGLHFETQFRSQDTWNCNPIPYQTLQLYQEGFSTVTRSDVLGYLKHNHFRIWILVKFINKEERDIIEHINEPTNQVEVLYEPELGKNQIIKLVNVLSLSPGAYEDTSQHVNMVLKTPMTEEQLKISKNQYKQEKADNDYLMIRELLIQSLPSSHH